MFKLLVRNQIDHFSQRSWFEVVEESGEVLSEADTRPEIDGMLEASLRTWPDKYRADEKILDAIAYQMRFSGPTREGECDYCYGETSEMYHLVQMRRYYSNSKQVDSITHHNCHDWFGHNDCLANLTIRGVH